MLSLLLPTAAQTDLLRACLWSGAAASEAWSRWEQAIGGAERVATPPDAATKGLLPLLHRAMRYNTIAVAPPIRAALGAAALVEAQRDQAYRRTCTRALETLAAASVPSLVLKGAAIAEMVYPEPTLRHSHDVDLLVGMADLDRAAGALRRAGFAASPVGQGRGATTYRVVDRSGLPIELHDRLFRLSFYAPPLAEVWARSRPCRIGACQAFTLSPADQLAQVCGQAACCRSRDSLRWVCDAWYLIERASALDWEVLLQIAAASRLSLPLAAQLEYLRINLEAAIPAAVRERLADHAARAGRTERDIALFCVRAGARGTLRNLFCAAPDWSDRVELLRWMLLPSPDSLRRGPPLRYPRLWRLEYVARPGRYLLRAFRRR
jgi:hypothetical protein